MRRVRFWKAIWPARQGGAGLADVLFGRVAPGGRLAETFPLAQSDVASDAFFPGSGRRVEYREGLYVGYRYFDSADKPVLFPFGHGLSYTTFDYANLRLTAGPVDRAATLDVEFDLTNAGDVAGSEIVQVYVSDPVSSCDRPAQELRAFAKVTLAPGQTERVKLSVDVASFAAYDAAQHTWVTEAGTFEIRIGASSRDIRLTGAVEVTSDQRWSENAPGTADTLTDAGWIDASTAAVDALEASGIAVDRDARPDIDPEAALGLGLRLVTSAMLLSSIEEVVEGGDVDAASSQTTHAEWLRDHTERERIRGQWGDFFTSFDAIIMPISFVPPFEHVHEGNFGTRTLTCNGETRPYSDLVKWTILTGMAYLPATTPPIGRGASGLPISFQVVGPYGTDYTTIRLAGHIAGLCGGFEPPPTG